MKKLRLRRKIKDVKFLNEINIKNVNFKYDENFDLTLNNINIKLNKGEFIGIKGETGAGRSTLVDIISGLLKPNKGSFKIEMNTILRLFLKIGITILDMFHKI